MALIANTTNATPFIYPNTTLLDRQSNPNAGIGGDGYLYCLVKVSTADNYTIYRSIDSGANWAAVSGGTFVRTGVVELGSMIVHQTGHCWITYRVNESSTDKIYVRRFYLPTGAYESEFLIASAANGGVAGAVYNGGVEIHPVATGFGQWVVIMATGYTSGSQHGVQFHSFTWSYTGGTTPVVNNGLLIGGRQYLYTGSGRVGPSIDLEHSGGGGKGSNNPSIWVAFGRTQLGLARLAWNGYGWNLQTSPVWATTSMSAQNYVCGRFDGSRFLSGRMVNDTVIIYERNKANTTTTPRTTPSHPAGNIRNYSITYDSAGTGNFRVYAIGTSTTVLYYVDYTRSGGTWTSWTTVSASSILGTTGDNFGVRRGTYGGGHYDAYYAVSGAPNTLTFIPQGLSYPPSAPTILTPTDGMAADVNATLPIDWQFNDPDPADVQSAYAMSRQIGAGSVNYFRASDSTWQATEQKNVTSSTVVNLSSGWQSGTDAATVYKVKTWDSTDVASAYSSGVAVIPSVKVNPTITAPTVSQVLTSSSVVATWTVSEQTQYRVRLSGSGTYDSGWITGSSLTYTPPTVLADGTSWTLTLNTRNNEGLISNDVTVSFTVAYTQSPGPTIVATPLTSSGVIRVAITNPAVVGSQPALASVDLWRRVVGTYSTTVNTNPYFETNLTDWAGTGAAIARDNAQAHEGSWSMKVTPNGVATACYGESGQYVITQGVPMTAATWIRPNTGNKSLAIYLRWYTSGGSFVSASKVLSGPVATAWQYLQVTDVPPLTAGKVAIAAGIEGGTAPAGTDIVYADEVILTVADTTTPVKVATGLGSGATYDDWQAISGVSYEYRAQVYGVNGSSLYGPWKS